MYCAQKVPLTEEEIQKKREEAERKARRGEIDPMHEYAFQVICQVGWLLDKKEITLWKLLSNYHSWTRLTFFMD